MKKNNFKSLILAFLALGLVFTSCIPDDSNDLQTSTLNNDQKIADAKTAVAMEETLSAIEEFIDVAYEGKFIQTKVLDKQVTVVNCRAAFFEETSSLVSGLLTISFQDPCVIDGHNYKGSLSITYTFDATPNQVEFVYTFNDYYYDDINISGGGTIIKAYETDQRNRTLTHSFNISLLLPSQLTASREGRLVRDWVNLDLVNINNSVAEITGGWSDTVDSFISRIYDINPDSPLRYELGCGYFVSGLMNIENTNLLTQEMYSGVLDFGTGECDRVSTLTLSDDAETKITIID